MCKMSNYIHKMLLNTRGTASIVFLVLYYFGWEIDVSPCRCYFRFYTQRQSLRVLTGECGQAVQDGGQAERAVLRYGQLVQHRTIVWPGRFPHCGQLRDLLRFLLRPCCHLRTARRLRVWHCGDPVPPGGVRVLQMRRVRGVLSAVAPPHRWNVTNVE